jgi:hypothetical protein
VIRYVITVCYDEELTNSMIQRCDDVVLGLCTLELVLLGAAITGTYDSSTYWNMLESSLLLAGIVGGRFC